MRTLFVFALLASVCLGCVTDGDCQERGVCVSTNCVCYAPFSGATCDVRDDDVVLVRPMSEPLLVLVEPCGAPVVLSTLVSEAVSATDSFLEFRVRPFSGAGQDAPIGAALSAGSPALYNVDSPAAAQCLVGEAATEDENVNLLLQAGSLTGSIYPMGSLSPTSDGFTTSFASSLLDGTGGMITSSLNGAVYTGSSHVVEEADAWFGPGSTVFRTWADDGVHLTVIKGMSNITSYTVTDTNSGFSWLSEVRVVDGLTVIFKSRAFSSYDSDLDVVHALVIGPSAAGIVAPAIVTAVEDVLEVSFANDVTWLLDLAFWQPSWTAIDLNNVIPVIREALAMSSPSYACPRLAIDCSLVTGTSYFLTLTPSVNLNSPVLFLVDAVRGTAEDAGTVSLDELDSNTFSSTSSYYWSGSPSTSSWSPSSSSSDTSGPLVVTTISVDDNQLTRLTLNLGVLTERSYAAVHLEVTDTATSGPNAEPLVVYAHTSDSAAGSGACSTEDEPVLCLGACLIRFPACALSSEGLLGLAFAYTAPSIFDGSVVDGTLSGSSPAARLGLQVLVRGWTDSLEADSPVGDSDGGVTLLRKDVRVDEDLRFYYTFFVPTNTDSVYVELTDIVGGRVAVYVNPETPAVAGLSSPTLFTECLVNDAYTCDDESECNIVAFTDGDHTALGTNWHVAVVVDSLWSDAIYFGIRIEVTTAAPVVTLEDGVAKAAAVMANYRHAYFTLDIPIEAYDSNHWIAFSLYSEREISRSTTLRIEYSILNGAGEPEYSDVPCGGAVTWCEGFFALCNPDLSSPIVGPTLSIRVTSSERFDVLFTIEAAIRAPMPMDLNRHVRGALAAYEFVVYYVDVDVSSEAATTSHLVPSVAFDDNGVASRSLNVRLGGAGFAACCSPPTHSAMTTYDFGSWSGQLRAPCELVSGRYYLTLRNTGTRSSYSLQLSLVEKAFNATVLPLDTPVEGVEEGRFTVSLPATTEAAPYGPAALFLELFYPTMDSDGTTMYVRPVSTGPYNAEVESFDDDTCFDNGVPSLECTTTADGCRIQVLPCDLAYYGVEWYVLVEGVAEGSWLLRAYAAEPTPTVVPVGSALARTFTNVGRRAVDTQFFTVTVPADLGVADVLTITVYGRGGDADGRLDVVVTPRVDLGYAACDGLTPTTCSGTRSCRVRFLSCSVTAGAELLVTVSPSQSHFFSPVISPPVRFTVAASVEPVIALPLGESREVESTTSEPIFFSFTLAGLTASELANVTAVTFGVDDNFDGELYLMPASGGRAPGPSTGCCTSYVLTCTSGSDCPLTLSSCSLDASETYLVAAIGDSSSAFTVYVDVEAFAYAEPVALSPTDYGTVTSATIERDNIHVYTIDETLGSGDVLVLILERSSGSSLNMRVTRAGSRVPTNMDDCRAEWDDCYGVSGTCRVTLRACDAGAADGAFDVFVEHSSWSDQTTTYSLWLQHVVPSVIPTTGLVSGVSVAVSMEGPGQTMMWSLAVSSPVNQAIVTMGINNVVNGGLDIEYASGSPCQSFYSESCGEWSAYSTSACSSLSAGGGSECLLSSEVQYITVIVVERGNSLATVDFTIDAQKTVYTATSLGLGSVASGAALAVGDTAHYVVDTSVGAEDGSSLSVRMYGLTDSVRITLSSRSPSFGGCYSDGLFEQNTVPFGDYAWSTIGVLCSKCSETSPLLYVTLEGTGTAATPFSLVVSRTDPAVLTAGVTHTGSLKFGEYLLHKFTVPSPAAAQQATIDVTGASARWTYSIGNLNCNVNPNNGPGTVTLDFCAFEDATTLYVYVVDDRSGSVQVPTSYTVTVSLVDFSANDVALPFETLSPQVVSNARLFVLPAEAGSARVLTDPLVLQVTGASAGGVVSLRADDNCYSASQCNVDVGTDCVRTFQCGDSVGSRLFVEGSLSANFRVLSPLTVLDDSVPATVVLDGASVDNFHVFRFTVPAGSTHVVLTLTYNVENYTSADMAVVLRSAGDCGTFHVSETFSSTGVWETVIESCSFGGDGVILEASLTADGESTLTLEATALATDVEVLSPGTPIEVTMAPGERRLWSVDTSIAYFDIDEYEDQELTVSVSNADCKDLLVALGPTPTDLGTNCYQERVWTSLPARHLLVSGSAVADIAGEVTMYVFAHLPSTESQPSSFTLEASLSVPTVTLLPVGVQTSVGANGFLYVDASALSSPLDAVLLLNILYDPNYPSTVDFFGDYSYTSTYLYEGSGSSFVLIEICDYFSSVSTPLVFHFTEAANVTLTTPHTHYERLVLNEPLDLVVKDEAPTHLVVPVVDLATALGADDILVLRGTSFSDYYGAEFFMTDDVCSYSETFNLEYELVNASTVFSTAFGNMQLVTAGALDKARYLDVSNWGTVRFELVVETPTAVDLGLDTTLCAEAADFFTTTVYSIDTSSLGAQDAVFVEVVADTGVFSAYISTGDRLSEAVDGSTETSYFSYTVETSCGMSLDTIRLVVAGVSHIHYRVTTSVVRAPVMALTAGSTDPTLVFVEKTLVVTIPTTTATETISIGAPGTSIFMTGYANRMPSLAGDCTYLCDPNYCEADPCNIAVEDGVYAFTLSVPSPRWVEVETRTVDYTPLTPTDLSLDTVVETALASGERAYFRLPAALLSWSSGLSVTVDGADAELDIFLGGQRPDVCNFDAASDAWFGETDLTFDIEADELAEAARDLFIVVRSTGPATCFNIVVTQTIAAIVSVPLTIGQTTVTATDGSSALYFSFTMAADTYYTVSQEGSSSFFSVYYSSEPRHLSSSYVNLLEADNLFSIACQGSATVYLAVDTPVFAGDSVGLRVSVASYTATSGGSWVALPVRGAALFSLDTTASLTFSVYDSTSSYDDFDLSVSLFSGDVCEPFGNHLLTKSCEFYGDCSLNIRSMSEAAVLPATWAVVRHSSNVVSTPLDVTVTVGASNCETASDLAFCSDLVEGSSVWVDTSLQAADTNAAVLARHMLFMFSDDCVAVSQECKDAVRRLACASQVGACSEDGWTEASAPSCFCDDFLAACASVDDMEWVMQYTPCGTNDVAGLCVSPPSPPPPPAEVEEGSAVEDTKRKFNPTALVVVLVLLFIIALVLGGLWYTGVLKSLMKGGAKVGDANEAGGDGGDGGGGAAAAPPAPAPAPAPVAAPAPKSP